MKTTSRQMLLLCGIVLGMAGMAMQSCSEAARDDRPALCGNWESVEGKPDVLIYKEGKAYCNLQIFLCLFLEKLNMPQNTPVTKAS